MDLACLLLLYTLLVHLVPGRCLGLLIFRSTCASRLGQSSALQRCKWLQLPFGWHLPAYSAAGVYSSICAHELCRYYAALDSARKHWMCIVACLFAAVTC